MFFCPDINEQIKALLRALYLLPPFIAANAVQQKMCDNFLIHAYVYNRVARILNCPPYRVHHFMYTFLQIVKI